MVNDYMESKLLSSIKSQKPNATILTLNWKEAATAGSYTLTNNRIIFVIQDW